MKHEDQSDPSSPILVIAMAAALIGFSAVSADAQNSNPSTAPSTATVPTSTNAQWNVPPSYYPNYNTYSGMMAGSYPGQTFGSYPNPAASPGSLSLDAKYDKFLRRGGISDSDDCFLPKRKLENVDYLKIAKEVSLGYKKFSRDVYVYHWGEPDEKRSRNAPISNFFIGKAVQWSPASFARVHASWFSLTEAKDANSRHGGSMGPGLYAATDPVSSEDYGNGLFEIKMPKGTSYLDARLAFSTWFSPEVDSILQDGGCPARDIALLFQQSVGTPCHKIAVRVARMLHVSAIKYAYNEVYVAGCKLPDKGKIGSSAFVLIDPKLMTSKNVKGYLRGAAMPHFSSKKDYQRVSAIMNLIDPQHGRAPDDFAMTPKQLEIREQTVRIAREYNAILIKEHMDDQDLKRLSELKDQLNELQLESEKASKEAKSTKNRGKGRFPDPSIKPTDETSSWIQDHFIDCNADKYPEDAFPLPTDTPPQVTIDTSIDLKDEAGLAQDPCPPKEEPLSHVQNTINQYQSMINCVKPNVTHP